MVTQLDIYTEEKFEDEEDMRERRLAGHHEAPAESDPIADDLVRLAKQLEDVYPAVIEVLGHLHNLVNSGVDA